MNTFLSKYELFNFHSEINNNLTVTFPQTYFFYRRHNPPPSPQYGWSRYSTILNIWPATGYWNHPPDYFLFNLTLPKISIQSMFFFIKKKDIYGPNSKWGKPQPPNTSYNFIFRWNLGREDITLQISGDVGKIFYLFIPPD